MDKTHHDPGDEHVVTPAEIDAEMQERVAAQLKLEYEADAAARKLVAK